jgi:FkbM family methyltransferase|tara:strand:+ start:1877 stop:2566 length:690 start_codon:yes stop_codon:yes gene_type:complete
MLVSENEINKKVFLDFFDEEQLLTIFDVGTYDGKDSLEFKKLFSKSIIYSFEADKRSVDVFNKVVTDTEDINLIETALSDVDGQIDWYASDSETRRHYEFEDGWSASSSIKKPDNHLNIFKDISFNSDSKVNSKRLDTWMSENKDIDNIDIMWVDVNGGENEFINGALKTLRNKVRYLYIEFNGVEDKTLYEGCPTADDIKEKLGCFEQLGTYNFLGNFGNILLKNKDI